MQVLVWGASSCFPKGQENGRARHWLICVAPVEAVVVPVEQLEHCACDTAPVIPRYDPRAQGTGAVAPGPQYVPIGVTVHTEAPARVVHVPALHATHCSGSMAPGLEEAEPGGQRIQPLEVCPMDGLKLPEGQFRQLEREVAVGKLLKVPRGQGVH